MHHSWKHQNSGWFQGPCMPNKRAKVSSTPICSLGTKDGCQLLVLDIPSKVIHGSCLKWLRLREERHMQWSLPNTIQYFIYSVPNKDMRVIRMLRMDFTRAQRRKPSFHLQSLWKASQARFSLHFILLPYYQGKLSPRVFASSLRTPNCRSFQAGSGFQIRAQFPSLAPSLTVNIPSF